MYMEKKDYGHKISIAQFIDTLFQREKKRKKDNVIIKIQELWRIVIYYIVYAIVIKIIKNVHNLFAILFQRNPRL